MEDVFGRAAVGCAGMLLAGALAACTSSKPGPTITVTKTATPASSPSGSAPSSATSSATSSGTNTSATASPSAGHQTGIAGTCDTLLADGTVYSAIGIATLPGHDAFVVGQPEPDIGRLAYLNCRYGVTGTAQTPAIEIGVSLYASAAQATTRIGATVADYTAHGASESDVAVSGQPAKLLTGGVGDGYAVPLLVVADGQRTVAVGVAASVGTGAKAAHDATALAALALDRTGH